MQFQERRFGKFSIEGEVVVACPEIVQKVMGECVILRAECRFQTNTFEYEAWSPAFDIHELGAEVPTYDVVYSEENDVVTWSRQEN